MNHSTSLIYLYNSVYFKIFIELAESNHEKNPDDFTIVTLRFKISKYQSL